MAEQVQRFRQYEYRANSNLVLTSDHARVRNDEPSGEPESLKDHLGELRFGDRVHHSKPDLEGVGKKRRAEKNAAWVKKSKKESETVLGLTYPAALRDLMQVDGFLATNAAFVASIGVLVPCHRSAAEIGRTIESILANGIRAAHVMIIDNANAPSSPDDTEAVVAKYPGVVYLYVPIGLKANALCVGASRLPPTCKHVFHFDDDTIMPPGMVFDERHFDDPTTAAVSYDISCFQDGVTTA